MTASVDTPSRNGHRIVPHRTHRTTPALQQRKAKVAIVAGEPTEMTQVDDATLLRRHLAGDRDAFAQIFRRHRDRLWSVALRTLGNPADAADAVQDAMLSAVRSAPSFRGDAQVGTWLYRIVVNACVSRLRRPAALPLDEAIGTDSPDPAERAAVAVDVQDALAALPAEQRLAVVLVDVEGLPVADVAELLGVPVGTIKSRCFRARAALAVALGHLRAGNRTTGEDVQPPTATEAEGDVT